MTPPAGVAECLNLADIEALGRSKLDQNALDYFSSGANDEVTLRENRAAFQRLKLRPRMLVDVSQVDTRTEVLGLPLDSPIGIAPSAFHGLAHPQAELATARAAAGQGSVMTLSTFANTPVEAVAQAAAGRLWYQLYLYRDRAFSAQLIGRAEAAGAQAVVFTVDAPFLGRREVNLRRRFELPAHLNVPNVGNREVLRSVAATQRHQQQDQASWTSIQTLVDASFTWADLPWLKAQTELPIVLKGLLTAEDADLAAQHGCHVWVSNHGGRQLDTAISSIEALSEVVDAVAGRVEVYLDGGVTRGTDVLKAVALGARAVFLGRAPLYGLAADGEHGVRRVLQLLQDEFRLAMALCGKQNVGQLESSVLRV